MKLYPDGSYQILDEDEYDEHGKLMHYSKDIKEIVEKQMQELLKQMETEQPPFNKKSIHEYYQKYIELLTKSDYNNH